LTQYPITDDEVLNFLDHLSDEYGFEKTRLIGDIRPAIIDHIIQMVKMPRIIRLVESENEKVSKS